MIPAEALEEAREKAASRGAAGSGGCHPDVDHPIDHYPPSYKILILMDIIRVWRNL
jgi:hypothetical protein